MHTIISISRDAEGLWAHTLNITLLQDTQIERLDVEPDVDFARLCQAETYALDACPTPLTPGQTRLQSSWQALGAVQTPDANALLSILVTIQAGACIGERVCRFTYPRL